jgi:hypothetical protein
MIIGPSDPNVRSWLASLEPVDRLATIMALSHVFAILTVDKEWQREMSDLRDELNPTGSESEDLLIRTAAMGAAVKREMAEGGAKPVTARRKKAVDRSQTNLMLPVAGRKEISEQVPEVNELPAAKKMRSRNTA